MLYLPSVSWNTTKVSATTLNKVATPASVSQLTVAAQNKPIRVLYGAVRVGADIANVVPQGQYWVFQCVWGYGAIDAITRLTMNDEALPVTAIVSHHMGEASQPIDAILLSAFSEKGFSYTDTLSGIAYSVVKVLSSNVSSMPQFNAEIRGLKLFDPRDISQVLADPSTWKYSDNPTLACANFACSTVYGMQRLADWTTVGTPANANDELVAGEKRRRLGLVIDTPQLCADWMDTLRTYAAVWCPIQNGLVTFVADKPTASCATYTFQDGKLASVRSLKKAGNQQAPNAIEIRYTNTSKLPYSEDSVWAYGPGVVEGRVLRVDSQVSMPGIPSASQAQREADERVNRMGADLSCIVNLYDDGMAHEVGDVITASDPKGLTAKEFRVLNIEQDYGRFALSCAEYDPNFYSSGVATGPTYPDTNLPVPSAPPMPTVVSLLEEAFKKQDGTWSSRLRLTWAVTSFMFLSGWQIEVYSASALVGSVTVGAEVQSVATGEVQGAINYLVRIRSLSSIGAQSAWVQQSKTPLGKLAPPSDVASLSVLEVGGELRITVGSATDTDMVGYELRYATPGGLWNSARFLAFQNAAAGVGAYVESKLVPAGSWDILCCAKDAQGNSSANPVRASVVVTVDPQAQSVQKEHDVSALTGVVNYPVIYSDSNTYYVTEDGVAAATKFPSTAASYGNVAVTYHTAQSSSVLMSVKDFGASITGSWSAAQHNDSALSGSLESTLELSVDGVTSWQIYPAMFTRGTSRFARQRYAASGAATLRVVIPASATRVDALPRQENVGPLTSLTSGGLPVQLTGAYCSIYSTPSVKPTGSSSLVGVADRILVAPDFGLQFQSVVAPGAGNAYAYQAFYDYGAGGLTVIAGDYLEYDVFVISAPDVSAWSIGGLTLLFSGGDYSNALSLPDQNGYDLSAWAWPGQVRGVWAHRKVALAPAVGKVIKKALVLNEADIAAGGLFECLIKNVQLTNGAGSVRAAYYGTSGEPQANSTVYTLRQSQIQMGPSNAFLASVFLSNTGARVAAPFNIEFWGI